MYPALIFNKGMTVAVANPDLRGGPVIQTLRYGGAVSKHFFSALRASVWSKNKGRPPPLDPQLSRNPNCFQMFFKMNAMQMACFTDFNTKIVKQCLVSTGANAPS